MSEIWLFLFCFLVPFSLLREALRRRRWWLDPFLHAVWYSVYFSFRVAGDSNHVATQERTRHKNGLMTLSPVLPCLVVTAESRLLVHRHQPGPTCTCSHLLALTLPTHTLLGSRHSTLLSELRRLPWTRPSRTDNGHLQCEMQCPITRNCFWLQD